MYLLVVFKAAVTQFTMNGEVHEALVSTEKMGFWQANEFCKKNGRIITQQLLYSKLR